MRGEVRSHRLAAPSSLASTAGGCTQTQTEQQRSIERRIMMGEKTANQSNPFAWSICEKSPMSGVCWDVVLDGDGRRKISGGAA